MNGDFSVTIYETIKAAISVKQAAEHYGLNVNRNGMACCPFHNDRHPSLKLASDFGLDPKPPTAVAMVKPKRPYIRQFREDEIRCFRVLTDYLHLVEDWKVRYTPKTPEDALDDRFVEACQMHCRIEYMADVLTVGDLEEQEFIGYCLIPSNKGQRMMVIKGNGGEGKSQIGAVLFAIFGTNMKDGSIGKISENRFARADLEHILLCVDDDMRMEALRQTNYVKSIVTAQDMSAASV